MKLFQPMEFSFADRTGLQLNDSMIIELFKPESQKVLYRKVQPSKKSFKKKLNIGGDKIQHRLIFFSAAIGISVSIYLVLIVTTVVLTVLLWRRNHFLMEAKFNNGEFEGSECEQPSRKVTAEESAKKVSPPGTKSSDISGKLDKKMPSSNV